MSDDPGLQTLRFWGQRTERVLSTLMPESHHPAPELARAMRYATLDGGKRLRASLVYLTGTMLGVDAGKLDRPAAAIEMIHAYSLVHDDLPAMDDDDLRRGKPTCHRRFGEAAAILAGDALQSLAFEILASDESGLDAAIRVRLIGELARAAGDRGMAGGQAIDLAAAGTRMTRKQLDTMHGLKTGALIRASVRIGALCGAPEDRELLAALDDFAGRIGLAFQIVDDILDDTVDSSTLGKPGGSDRALDKPTYTSVLGIDRARAVVDELVDSALERLATIGHNTGSLREIAGFVARRRN